MLKRLFWTLMTYIERPLFWGLSLITLGLCLWFFPTGERHNMPCHPQVALERGAVFDLHTLDSLVRDGRQSVVTGVSFERLWNDASQAALSGNAAVGLEKAPFAAAERLSLLANLPNLRFVTFDRRNAWTAGVDEDAADLPMQTIGRLAPIQELSLSFLGVKDIDEDVLQPLANLRELRRLQLEHFESLPSLDALAGLPKLETLILVFCEGMTPQRFEEIRQLQHLKTLVLPHLSQFEQSKQSLTLLREMPSLRTIYVSCSPDDQATLAAVRAAIPMAHVLRGWYDRSRVNTFLAASYWLCFLAAGSFHLVGQFSLPQSKLVPGFTLPHIGVAAGLFGLVVAVYSLLLWGHGANLLPGFAAVASCFLLCLALGAAGMSPSHFKRNRRTAALSAVIALTIGICVGIGPFLLMHNVTFFTPYLEAYLLGEANLVAVALVCAACAGGVALVAKLTKLQVQRAEAGQPVELAFTDWQYRQQIINGNDPGQNFFVRSLDHAIAEASAKDRGNTRWSRISRWRASIGSWQVWRMTILLFVVFGLVWPIVSNSTLDAAMERFLGTLGLFYFISALVVTVQWSQGYRYLQTALLWPLNRRTLVGDVFAAIGFELLLPLPFIATCIAGYLAFSGMLSGSVLFGVLAVFFGSIGVAFLCFAGSVWLVTMRSFWSMFFFAAAMYGMGSLILLPALAFSPQNAGPVTPTALRIAVVGFSACLVAAPIIALAYRRWMRLEFGRE